MSYKTPAEFYFRIHHIRPRFKNKVENVLVYMATEIAKLKEEPKENFINEVNAAIKRFPGNSTLVPKTVNNWRTEISSLFGYIEPNGEAGTMKPGARAIDLADKQDLVRAFKIFLYYFQYPGGHTKPHETVKYIEEGISFKPAKYILSLLAYAEKSSGRRVFINKAEATHLLFNDLRVTRDNDSPEIVWSRVENNRRENVQYDWKGDTIRYAGDILDYMVIANLLENHAGKYYVNWLEKEIVMKFLSDNTWFDKYDSMIQARTADIVAIRELQDDWFKFVNGPAEKVFDTDLLAFMSSDDKQYSELRKTYEKIFKAEKEDAKELTGTKSIGDIGETLIHGHECQRLKNGGRKDLVHLVQWIPTYLAMGYDIKSCELDSTQRLIEVKTTISNSEIDFSKFHLTPNEWSAAESHGERYFVYRLMISKRRNKLMLIKDPVGQYKQDKIKMVPRNGADLTIGERCGVIERLLQWTS